MLIKLGALAGLTTMILVLLYGQSRIFFTMSSDGLMPTMFSRVHPTLKTPYLSQLLIGIIVACVVPSVPWVPILGILFCLSLMLGLPLVTWLRLVVWLVIGLVIYFAHGSRHSRLRHT